VPDADQADEKTAFELTRPYCAKSQKCDPRRWQVFADFAFTHGRIEKAVTVTTLLPDLSGE